MLLLAPSISAPLPVAPATTDDTSVADVAEPVVAVLVAVAVAILVAALVNAVVRRAARRSEVAADLVRHSRRPLRAVLVIVAVWVALRLTTEQSHWRVLVEHALLIALIIAGAWLVGSLAFVLEDAAFARYRVDVADNRHARRVRTQVQVLRRITVAVIVICAIGAVLLTFKGARTFGASLLASAGLLSIVAGLAAQSSLANVFAGLQLAFTDALRVDDVVVVDGQWGRIEEITLTYVVVHAWDDRRLIMPSTFFTTTPFENWTRRDAHLLGTVELDVDWEVPVPRLRAEMSRLLDATDLWDGRVGVLQVTDAVGGLVRVRALASASDAPTLFDLRCYVREGLVAWLQTEAPEGLPRTRVDELRVTSRGGAGRRSERPGDGVDERRDDRGAGGSADETATPSAPVPVGTVEPGSTRRERRTTGATLPARPGGGPRLDETQVLAPAGSDARLFTGSIDAIERSRSFSGPGQDVIDEREATAHRDDEPADGDDPR